MDSILGKLTDSVCICAFVFVHHEKTKTLRMIFKNGHSMNSLNIMENGLTEKLIY